MKDIIRIHIAGTAYEIETEARKTLNAYLKSIEAYTDDPELLKDVEYRIVELLGEQGIREGQVIGADDVSAIIEQLGDAEAFSNDEPVTGRSETVGKKFYRDSAKAWVGGLAAGIGAYYRISPLWIRLVLLVSIPLTSGLSILLYILAWLIVPSTKTVSDVLRLKGQPVTVNSINGLDAAEAVRPGRDRKILRVVSIIAGVLILLGLVTVLVVAGTGLSLAASRGELDLFERFNSLGAELRILLVSSGIVTAVSSIAATLLISYLLISWRFKKPVLVVTAVLVALSLAGMVAGVGGAVVARQQANDKILQMVSTRDIPLNSLPGDATNLSIANFGSGSVSYVMSTTEKPHIEVTALKSDDTPTVSEDNGTVGITFGNPKKQTESSYAPTYTIYLRPFTTIKTRGIVNADGGNRSLDTLHLTAYDNSIITLSGVSVSALDVSLSPYASLDASQAAAKEVTLRSALYSSVQLGTVDTLDANVSTVCGDEVMGTTSIDVQHINDSLMVNGQNQPSQDVKQTCYEIRFGTYDKY